LPRAHELPGERAGYSEEQLLLGGAFRELVEDACPTDLVRRMLEDDEFAPEALWNTLVEAGWASAVYPARLGGQEIGFDLLTVLAVEAGRVFLPGPFWTSAMLTPLLLNAAGPATLDALPEAAALAAGRQVATFALQERPVGYPLGPLTARLSGNGSAAATGVKHFVPDAGMAQFVLTLVRDASGEARLTVIPTAGAGVTLTAHQTLDARRLFTLTLENAPVTATLDVDEAALYRFSVGAAILTAARQVGGAEIALADAVEYAKGRVQFGRPIGSFQAVSHRLVDLYCQVEIGRALVWKAVEGQMIGAPDVDLAASAAKAWANDMYRTVAKLALQTHGGVGVMYTQDSHLHLRAAPALAAEFGTTTHHRRLLKARGLDPPFAASGSETES
jgi:alkylation response protein AidB-like acyl-CoA dehydrogenase